MIITITRRCPFCREEHSFEMDNKEYITGVNAYNRGALIQDAFPTLSPNQRELIKTGICDKCWENM